MHLPLHIAHRYSAILLASFVLIHIGNHLTLLSGPQAHLVVMDTLRIVYRQPMLECLLLFAVAFQVFSGLRLALHQWRLRRGFILWLQAGTGAYLALFLLVHVGAVLSSRLLAGLDTNLWFAAAGLHSGPVKYFFVPYYLLAVIAIFTHVGCALYWRANRRPVIQRRAVLAVMFSLGLVCGCAIVLAMSTRIAATDFPVQYLPRFGAG